jgi:hypothetical protein
VPQRQVLLLRFFHDLSCEQTARLMDVSPGRVKGLQHRATEFLRDELIRAGYSPEVRSRRNWSRMRLRCLPVLRERRWALWYSGVRPGVQQSRSYRR